MLQYVGGKQVIAGWDSMPVVSSHRTSIAKVTIMWIANSQIAIVQSMINGHLTSDMY